MEYRDVLCFSIIRELSAKGSGVFPDLISAPVSCSLRNEDIGQPALVL